MSDLSPSGDAPVNLRVVRAGAPLDQARAAMLMVHGRGASAEDILSFAAELA
jgi:hypothetical protein